MKKFALLLFLAALTFASRAQEDATGRKGKFFLVPELWLSFGTTTYIEVAPMLGYHVLDRLAVGLGPHYFYQSQKASPGFPFAYKTHSYGLKGFARFSLLTNAEEWLPIKLFSELFVHAEYEVLSLEKQYYVPPYTDEGRFIYRGLLLGGGLSQRVGIYNTVSFTILWDINESVISPYSNPVFRVGFNSYF
ncbi:MAG: hypothetical protein P1P86_03335 [Bacteroidales bacterium]|nr:hypothetical protein [Bacteroidales bacterium]